MTTVIVSGGFDPVHPGHIALFQEARKLGDRLVVILNNDNWLRQKKRYTFMNELQRADIIAALRDVDAVTITQHPENPTDMSVCRTLEAIPKIYGGTSFIFANGGDRKNENTPEVEKCKELGFEMAFNVGGGKIESSSELIDRAKQRLYERPWGGYYIHRHEKDWALKTLELKPGEQTSLQSHKERGEFWMLVEGEADVDTGYDTDSLSTFPLLPFEIFHVRAGCLHRIRALGSGAKIVEVIQDRYDENDIIRYEDKYGRV